MFRGPLTVLLLRLSLVGALYSVLRIIFWQFNTELFPSPSLAVFLGGIRFDASAIAWLNMPWVLWFLVQPRPGPRLAKWQFGLFMFLNAIALFFNCVDIGYYAFSLRRSTADFLDILTTGNDTISLAPAFLRDYWYLLLIYLAGLALLAWGYQRIGRLRQSADPKWIWRSGWRVIAILLIGVATRGGTQLIPLQPLDAAKYGGASYIPVVLNTPFTMLMSLGKPALQERNYMSAEEADHHWPVIQQVDPYAIPTDTSVSKRPDHPNVVVIILESFSALYSHELSGEESYMPFLDSLMRESLTFNNAYANGRRSIDGIPAILASLPQWMDEAFITSQYASIPFSSIANILAAEGYSTSFYHGGRNGTMGFSGFTKSAGFERYVGLDQYPNAQDFDGHWGVRDRPFLQFYAQELASEEQPFFSSVFTLSSHHPYELPEAEAAQFAGGTLPIHATLRYTDDALRKFFATAKAMPWFENTLFVITADHTADLQRNGSQGNRSIDYWVPMFFHAPWIKPEMNERVTQHIDIQPTVFSLIGYEHPFFSFGHNNLAPSHPPVAIWSNNGLYTITSANQQIQFDGEEVLSISPAKYGAPQIPFETGAMALYLKAAIQQYDHHLIHGELTARSATE